MTDLDQLTEGQAEQLRRLEDLWPVYGHALQVTAQNSGGMSFRDVKGVDYLTRWYHEDGKKKGQSLGRRGPATEAQLAEFQNTVLKARRTLKDMRDDVGLVCRIAKAHGIARLPGRQADTLEQLWYSDAGRRLTLFGGAALLAYESESGIMTPGELIKDHLRFVTRSFDEIDLDEIMLACAGRDELISVKKDHKLYIRTDDDTVCEIYLPTYFTRYLDREPAQTLMDSFDLPPVKGLTVSRDCKPLELSALDPRVYAMAANCLRDEEIWAERADFSAAMVRQRWAEGFDDAQDAVFEEEPDSGRLRNRGPY
jgi:hypothetical protein